MTDRHRIAILEDDAARTYEFSACIRECFPDYKIEVFDNAPDMIRWLPQYLSDTRLICLDHDLGPNRLIGEQPFDPGTGRDVADYLATRQPICPVLIHTTNSLAAPGMQLVLDDAGWQCLRIVPYNDLEWVRGSWLEMVGEALSRSEQERTDEGNRR